MYSKHAPLLGFCSPISSLPDASPCAVAPYDLDCPPGQGNAILCCCSTRYSLSRTRECRIFYGYLSGRYLLGPLTVFRTTSGFCSWFSFETRIRQAVVLLYSWGVHSYIYLPDFSDARSAVAAWVLFYVLFAYMRVMQFGGLMLVWFCRSPLEKITSTPTWEVVNLSLGRFCIWVLCSFEGEVPTVQVYAPPSGDSIHPHMGGGTCHPGVLA